MHKKLLMKMFFFTNICLFLSVLVGLTACENQPNIGSKVEQKIQNPIEITDAWIRWMPPESPSTAAFLKLQNHTGKPLILKAISTNWAKHSMFHQTIIQDGMAKMQHLDQITIDQQLEFKPGHKHIMIMGLNQSLQKGEHKNILLHFEGQPSLEVSFEVRDASDQ